MGKKDSIRAARAYTKRDTKAHPEPPDTQGSLGERYVQTHTPESLYPADSDDGAK